MTKVGKELLIIIILQHDDDDYDDDDDDDYDAMCKNLQRPTRV